MRVGNVALSIDVYNWIFIRIESWSGRIFNLEKTVQIASFDRWRNSGLEKWQNLLGVTFNGVEMKIHIFGFPGLIFSHCSEESSSSTDPERKWVVPGTIKTRVSPLIIDGRSQGKSRKNIYLKEGQGIDTWVQGTEWRMSKWTHTNRPYWFLTEMQEQPNGISKDSLFNKWCHRKIESIGEIFRL